MIRVLVKIVKWLLLLLVLAVIGLGAPVAYVELACHKPMRQASFSPLITDISFQRRMANTYLTYPEWHIVYAYDGLAETLKTGDEHAFPYAASIVNFWKSTCAMTGQADAYGGADSATRTMIHVIGVSFTLEMGLKAAYEETVGRVFAMLRGAEKSPQDQVSATMAVEYARFLRQTPWYKYDFESEVARLWAAPVDGARSLERRLALGGEWRAKTLYAQAIAAGVAATGEAQLVVRSVVAGLPSSELQQIPDVTVINEMPEGVVIQSPRYDRFTQILIAIARAGGQVKEIAGNDRIMVTVTQSRGQPYAGPGSEILRIGREGFDGDRVLVDVDMGGLTELLKTRPLADPGIEHVFDY